MKTFDSLREEQEDLQEISLVRAGAALLFARKVKTYGTRAESSIRQARSNIKAAVREDDIEKKIDKLLDGMVDLAEAQYAQRFMLGNLTGVAVSAAVLAERTGKEMKKLMKGSRR